MSFHQAQYMTYSTNDDFTLIVVIKMCLLNMNFFQVIESTTPESNVMESLLPIIMLGVFSETGCKGLNGVLPNPMGRGASPFHGT
jgi:hypothetical protein